MEDLGKKMRDKVTGYEGIAVAKIQYLNGCVQYCVKPTVSEDGKMPEGEYIDIHQLDIVDDGVNVKPSETGGPQPDRPKFKI